MDKISALNELKALLDSGSLKYSQYSEISDTILGVATAETILRSKNIINNLIDNKQINIDCYITLKSALNEKENQIRNNESLNASVANDTNITVTAKTEPTFKGAGIGFVLTFFLNAIGLILCLLMGDEQCKKASIITIIVCACIGVAGGIIYGIWVAIAVSSFATYYPYVNALIPLL